MAPCNTYVHINSTDTVPIELRTLVNAQSIDQKRKQRITYIQKAKNVPE